MLNCAPNVNIKGIFPLSSTEVIEPLARPVKSTSSTRINVAIQSIQALSNSNSPLLLNDNPFAGISKLDKANPLVANVSRKSVIVKNDQKFETNSAESPPCNSVSANKTPTNVNTNHMFSPRNPLISSIKITPVNNPQPKDGKYVLLSSQIVNKALSSPIGGNPFVKILGENNKNFPSKNTKPSLGIFSGASLNSSLLKLAPKQFLPQRVAPEKTISKDEKKTKAQLYRHKQKMLIAELIKTPDCSILSEKVSTLGSRLINNRKSCVSLSSVDQKLQLPMSDEVARLRRLFQNESPSRVFDFADPSLDTIVKVRLAKEQMMQPVGGAEPFTDPTLMDTVTETDTSGTSDPPVILCSTTSASSTSVNNNFVRRPPTVTKKSKRKAKNRKL